MLADGAAAEGDWLVARAQDAGRGRQGRSWQSLDGNFFGSTLILVRPDDPPPPILSLAAGVALIDAIDLVAPARPLVLKWPNDLMLGGGKLAGILLERNGERIVAGFGVNLAVAPDVPRRETASLDRVTEPTSFAPLLAGSMARQVERWRNGLTDAIRADWLSRAHPVGALLTVHASAQQTISGTFDGIEPDGALRLDTDTGVQIIRAGDVAL